MTNLILSALGAFAFGMYVASVITESRAGLGCRNPGALTGSWAMYIFCAALLIKFGIFLA
jgi:hypothetical protein